MNLETILIIGTFCYWILMAIGGVKEGKTNLRKEAAGKGVLIAFLGLLVFVVFAGICAGLGDGYIINIASLIIAVVGLGILLMVYYWKADESFEKDDLITGLVIVVVLTLAAIGFGEILASTEFHIN